MSWRTMFFLSAFVAGQCSWTWAVDLVNESFDGVGPLKPFESATESGGDGTDWTDQLPAGWVGTFIGPVGPPLEFQGWRILDVDSWVATEGNQRRVEWTRGGVGSRGSVLVADPDAYDDGTEIDTAQFNAYVTTPPVDLATLVPNTVSIAFDSFWRNEVTQIGTLDVSFDGGTTYSNLLTYDSSAMGDGDLIDAREQFAVNNPSSGSLLFRFGLTEGSNDWWWAVDDVQIQGQLVPEPSSAIVCGLAALVLGMMARRRSS